MEKECRHISQLAAVVRESSTLEHEIDGEGIALSHTLYNISFMKPYDYESVYQVQSSKETHHVTEVPKPYFRIQRHNLGCMASWTHKMHSQKGVCLRRRRHRLKPCEKSYDGEPYGDEAHGALDSYQGSCRTRRI